MRSSSQVVRIGALAIVALGLALTSTACSKKLDPTSSADAIKAEYTKQIAAAGGTVTITSVSCPSDIEAKTGVTFMCTITLSTGETAQAKGTQIDDSGKFNAEIVSGPGSTGGGGSAGSTPTT